MAEASFHCGEPARLPGGTKLLHAEQGGLYAAFVFFVTLSLMLVPAVYNALLTKILLWLALHVLLLASSFFMWEALFRPGLVAKQRDNMRTRLMVLGSILLFPVCIWMIGANYEAYPSSGYNELCASPTSMPLSIPYSFGSTSTFGGLLLMATQQLSFALAKGCRTGRADSI